VIQDVGTLAACATIVAGQVGRATNCVRR
jgi:hypothetical protein